MYQQTFPGFGTAMPNPAPGYPNYFSGVAYAPRPQPRYTQPVTAELSKMLNHHNDELDIRISNAEKIRNWCTHKEPTTGRLALVENGDGTVTCRTCGATFRPMDDEKIKKLAESGGITCVKDVIQVMIDLMQTSKALWIDAPEEFVKNYYQSITMLQRFYDIFVRSEKNFGMHEGYLGMVMPNNPGYNDYRAAQNILQAQFGQPYGFGMPAAYYGTNPAAAMYGMGTPAPVPGYPAGYPQSGYGQPAYPQQPPVDPSMMYGAQPQQPVAPQAPNPAQYATWPAAWNGNLTGGVPTIGPDGNVYPSAAPANAAPPAPGANPFVQNPAPVPGAMTAPAAPAPQPQAGTPSVTEPTQTKQMVV